LTRIAAARPAPQDDLLESPRVGVGIGHNAPPPEEMARIDFNDAIDKHEGLRSRIATLVDSSTRAQATNDDEAGRCAELIRQMSAAEKVVDTERTSVKGPYLNAGRAIDDAAKTLVADLVNAKARVRRIAEDFMREQQRKADEAARAARLEAERLASIERERAAAEHREPEPVAPPPPPKAENVQVRSDFGAVASSTKRKVGVITDWNKAFRRVSKVPAVQEAVQKAVNALVRANETNIPGVEITEEVGLSVR
jgi:hypothetical protein